MTKFRLPSAAAAVFFFLVGETVSKGRPPRDSQLSPSSQPPISPFARHSAGAGGPQQHIKPTPSMSQKLHPPSSMKSQLHPQQSQVPGKKGGMHPGAQQIRGDPCSTQNIKPYLKDVRSLTDAENHISQCANKICITRSTTTVVSAAVWAVFADSAYEVLKKFGAEVSQQSFNSLGNCVAYLPTSAISKMTWTEINIMMTQVPVYSLCRPLLNTWKGIYI